MKLCPTYNEECTPQWFMQRIHKVEDTNRTLQEARNIATITEENINTGIIYRNTKLETYYELLKNRKNSSTELVDEVNQYDIQKLFDQFK
jgi:hypothetical protein